ncbi:MAG: nucleoside deaminase [Syntrophomonadaceae bacterium]|nr:nucleoside deaminase [Syntrophomonadaceae bacterium]
MEIARLEARLGSELGDGGPFGAVVVKDGRVVASAHNLVLKLGDSTAHAEMVAIRRAERALGTYDLSGCELYTTAYPCPMCLGAIMWARISRVYYGCSPQDAAAIGFDDQLFYEALRSPADNRLVSLRELESEECREVFRRWREKGDRVVY